MQSSSGPLTFSHAKVLDRKGDDRRILLLYKVVL